MTDGDLIEFLRNKTHLARFSMPEIRDLLARMDEGGWEVVRKSDGAIIESIEPDVIEESTQADEPAVTETDFSDHG